MTRWSTPAIGSRAWSKSRYKDGRMVREHVIDCRGRPENPMSPEEVEKKAAWLMEPVLGKNNVDQIIDSVRRIESISSVRDLTKLLVVA